MSRYARLEVMREHVVFENKRAKIINKKRRRHIARRVSIEDVPGFRVTNRDIEIVKAVYAYRALTTPQIERLLFPPDNRQDHPTKTSRCQHRLKLLFHAQYLCREEQPQRLSDGRKPLLHFLDENGAQLLARVGEIERSRIAWKRKDNRVSPMFLEHLLATNDVRIAVSLAARRLGMTLERWLDEKTLKSKAVKDYVEVVLKDKNGHNCQRKKLAVVPDGYFVLSLGGRRGHFFLEIDLATEPGKRWADKVRGYLAYLESGLYQKRYQTRSLRVLTVTTGPKRLENLRQTTQAVGGGSLFWFTTLALAQPATVLSDAIWQRARMEGLHSLIERPSPKHPGHGELTPRTAPVVVFPPP